MTLWKSNPPPAPSQVTEKDEGVAAAKRRGHIPAGPAEVTAVRRRAAFRLRAPFTHGSLTCAEPSVYRPAGVRSQHALNADVVVGAGDQVQDLVRRALDEPLGPPLGGARAESKLREAETEIWIFEADAGAVFCDHSPP